MSNQLVFLYTASSYDLLGQGNMPSLNPIDPSEMSNLPFLKGHGQIEPYYLCRRLSGQGMWSTCIVHTYKTRYEDSYNGSTCHLMVKYNK